jgi:diguanylate cyclase (GGDEF)-like protein
MIDIDHFKTINDTKGHEAGDRTLVDITEIMGEDLHEGDVLTRWGGEEFVMVLRGHDCDDAVPHAHALRQRIADSDVGCTVSIGVAALRPTDTLSTLIDRADKSLYDAKAAGRNAVASRD